MAPNGTRQPFICERGCLVIAPQNESIAVSLPFNHSSFGAFLNDLFRGVFTRRSQATFLRLSLGFVFAFTRHTVASYLWRAGAVSLKHFTRYYVFLGAPCYQNLEALFARVIVAAAAQVPTHEPIRLRFDDTTVKKTGAKIEGGALYRNGAGTARQEYRTLFGLNFVLAEMRIRLAGYPEHFVSVPIGLALYLKKPQAEALERPYWSRSQLARQMLDQVCALVGPERPIWSVQDGHYATKAFLRGLPDNVEVVGRLWLDSPLYARAEPKPPGQPGRPAEKGRRLGNPKELAEAAGTDHWQAHPSEAGAEILVVEGFWHSVWPGRWLRVVIVRRPEAQVRRQKKALEAYFTSLTQLEAAQMLCEYRGRWSIEIVIREAREHYGFGQDRCRRVERVIGVNGFRLVVGAAQVLWFAREVEQQGAVALRPYQPWYRQKAKPSLHDMAWAVRERLLQEGITPTVGFWQGLGVIHGLHSERRVEQLPRAA